NKIAALQPRLQLRLFERAFRCYMRRQPTGEPAAHFLAERLQAGDDGVERGSDLACLQIKLTARRQIGAGGFYLERLQPNHPPPPAPRRAEPLIVSVPAVIASTAGTPDSSLVTAPSSVAVTSSGDCCSAIAVRFSSSAIG